MKLSDASSYFDRTPILDADSGKQLFLGQLDPYDDSKRDSSTAYRRTLSVRPGTAMPTRRAVRALGKTWLVGVMEPDGLDELHREKYVLQQAPGTLKISSLSGFLSGTVSNTYFASANWVKDAKQLEVSSATPQLFDVTFASTAAVSVHDILWDASAAYLSLSPRPQPSGYTTVDCLKLDSATPVSATLTSRTYDPVSGAYTSSAPVVLNSVKLRWQSLFQYGSQMSERFQEGDSTLVLPSGTAVTTSHSVAVAGVSHQVLAVMDISGAVALHLRAA